MAKRIFRNMVLTVLLAVLFTAMLIVSTLYNAHESSMSRQLRQEADIIADALEMAEDDIGYLNNLNIDSRITFVSADGVVLFDSEANPAQMENHAASIGKYRRGGT